MSDFTWTVEVDGLSHTVAIDNDWQTGKAAIRVDGRAAAKPLSAGEDERQFAIGSTMYIVRRMPDDTFTLDLAPPDFEAPSAPAQRRTMPGKTAVRSSESRGFPLKTVIGIVLVLLFVVAKLRTGKQGLQYMQIDWKPYKAADGSFSAAFPAEPEMNSEEKNIRGDIWSFNTLSSSYKGHFYAVQYFDAHTVVVDDNAYSLMERFLDGWEGAIGGKMSTSDRTFINRNQAIRFVATIPPKEEYKMTVPATQEGYIIRRRNRLFLVWTLRAQADEITTDVKKFYEQFALPPPPE